MSKYTDYILKIIKPKSKKSDWEGRSKHDIGGVIICSFRNKLTNKIIYIKDEDGKLSIYKAEKPEKIKKKSKLVSIDTFDTFTPKPLDNEIYYTYTSLGHCVLKSQGNVHTEISFDKPKLTNDEFDELHPHDGEEEYKDTLPPDSWTGRIIYGIFDDVDEIYFSCGPETKLGNIDDDYDGGTEEVLNELFADFQKEIGITTNRHAIYVPEGLNVAKAKKIVKQRLEAAGAVRSKLYG